VQIRVWCGMGVVGVVPMLAWQVRCVPEVKYLWSLLECQRELEQMEFLEESL